MPETLIFVNAASPLLDNQFAYSEPIIIGEG